MPPHLPAVVVPHQARRLSRADDVEGEVARTAALVLHLTALADRYADCPDSAERVALLRDTAATGRQALVGMAAELPVPAHGGRT